METPTPPIQDSPSGPSITQWKVILHLSAFAVFVLPMAGNVFAPLIVWLIKKQASPALDAEGRKVLNFQISYTIYFLLAGTIATALFFLVIPVALPAIVFVAWLILTIIGTVKTSNGEDYQFPFVIRML